MTLYHRFRLIFRLVVFLTSPFLVSWLAFYIVASGGESPPAPRWVSTARIVLAVFLVLFTSMPFLLEGTFTSVRALLVHRRNRDPNEVALSMAIVFGGLSPMLAFMLFAAGGQAADVYVTSTISVASTLFWLSRYRRVFRRNGVTT